MPFVQRAVQPVCLSKQPLRTEDGQLKVKDEELEAVNNNTLASALRQLASLVLVADDIFRELTRELRGVCDRARVLRERVNSIEEKVAAFDPKTVAVPESDICTFSQLRTHFVSCPVVATSSRIFTPDTRPSALQAMYDACVKTPVHVMREMDAYRRDGARSSRYFMCTPVLGGRRKRRHKEVAAIETSKPAVFEDLRRWTSIEALGDVTVGPDCTSRISLAASTSVTIELGEEVVDAPVMQDATDHKLPSPEEQVQVIAMHFPAEVVPVDVSGRPFARMSSIRRSMGLDGTVRRRERSRRVRGKRRNTIAACTDKKELEEAVVAGDSANDSLETTDIASTSTVQPRGSIRTKLRSRSSDLLRSKTDVSPPDKKSHFESLRQWGSAKLRLIRGKSQELHPKTPPMPEDFNIYEAIHKGKKSEPKKTKSSLPISTPSGVMSMAVKLREGSLRRQRAVSKDEPIHSSSGNWSASSESGRASINSETTTTTPQPKSTTMSSPGTSSQSLHQPPSSVSSRRRFNTSTSSSFSEGTLTPDIGSDLPFVDDGENSSIYSCDTEGYYTSFHLDSGLKPLKEEDTPMTPLHSSSALSHSPRTLSAENEYELFGKGSTSTTTSSAGTVCTTLLAGNNDSSLSLALAPAVPERKSSLEPKNESEKDKVVVAMIHKEFVSYSPDSGHNTSSSPVDSTSSPHGTLRSSECEFSESDFEGVERIERIRVKTMIRSSDIPSMCVITPPQSDDEVSLNHYMPLSKNNQEKIRNEAKTMNLSPAEVRVISELTEVEHAKVNKKRNLNKNDLKLEISANITEKFIQETHFDVELTPEEENKKESPKEEICNDKYQKTEDSKEEAPAKTPIQPFNILGKVKDVLTSVSIKKTEETDIDEGMMDAGDYVTIADIRNNKVTPALPVLYANCTNSKYPVLGKVRETEYVCLNELPVLSNQISMGNMLQSPADSLERKKRQGARVTLDSEGKVVYSSDSLKRVKGHTTFEPGPYIKETILTPTPSPIPLHRVPKTNIRPVNQQGKNSPLPIHTVFPATYTDKTPSPVLMRKNQSPTRRLSPNSPKLGKVIIRANSPATRVVSPTSPRAVSPKRIVSPTATRSTRAMSPKTIGKVVSPVPSRSVSPKAVVSPTNSRPMSPKAAGTRGAYVHMLGPERCSSPQRPTTNLATMPEEEGKIPPCPTNPKQLTSYLQRTNPMLFNRINDPNGKVKRSDSYRMANSSLLSSIKKVSNIEVAAQKNNTSVNTFHSDVVLETNRLNPHFDDKRKNLMDGVKDGNLKTPLAFDEKATKEVVNPNLLGRKFYGTQIKVDPNIFASSSQKDKETKENTEKERRVNERRKKDSERARFLESGNTDTEIW